MAALQTWTWDIFCRVVDNLGDAGVCWRLAADLAARGQRVRLVIDDAAPLALIAPHGAAGVTVERWPGAMGSVGDVVIEAFGCDPPPGFVAAMAARQPAPEWLNLEYLSAESYVERSHGLPSPQRNGLVKHFFFPGFTPHTGGLLREPGLIDARAAFDRAAWLRAQGIELRPGERVVTLFCYANAAVPALLEALAQQATLLLLTPGPAQLQVAHAPAGIRLHRLPWLAQAGFDRLLWAGDINFVRGEDSLARALWAGAPFVWQLYPQHDGAQFAKLDAMLALLAPPADVAVLWRAWNGAPGVRWPAALPHGGGWSAATRCLHAELLRQPDLTTQLLTWVSERAATPTG